jgi:hypothetical protein
MTIQINPGRINMPVGGGKPSDQRRTLRDSQVPKPARAHLNIIPEPETLATLIRSAVAALRQGTTWDRGTILNLVV